MKFIVSVNLPTRNAPPWPLLATPSPASAANPPARMAQPDIPREVKTVGGYNYIEREARAGGVARGAARRRYTCTIMYPSSSIKINLN
jgi:hypothetical protein